jgi:hypothetical protein
MEGGRLDTWGEVPQLTNWQLENCAVRIGCMWKEIRGGASDATTCISAHRDELVPREASWNIGLYVGDRGVMSRHELHYKDSRREAGC